MKINAAFRLKSLKRLTAALENVSNPSARYWLTRIAPSKDQSALTEIESALTSQYPKVISKNAKGLVNGAIAFGHNDNGGEQAIEVHHLGSLEKGVGTQLMKRAIAKAKREDLPIILFSKPEAVGFYKKLGFVNHTGDHLLVLYP